MKSAAIFASLLATAAAFAPASQQSASTSSLSASKYANELGSQAPLGFFDPMGLLEDASQERFDRLRFLEIKHGRVCMLAVTGYLATASGLRFPGDIAIGGPAFADIPSGIEAFKYVPGAGVLQIVAFIAVLEMVMRDVTGKNEFVGDFRNGMFSEYGWDKLSPEVKRKKRAIELNNGRAAMMGITGLVLHEVIGNPLLPLK